MSDSDWVVDESSSIQPASEIGELEGDDDEMAFRRGFVHGVVCAIEAVFEDKAKEQEMFDFVDFLMIWRFHGGGSLPPCIWKFRHEMRKERSGS